MAHVGTSALGCGLASGWSSIELTMREINMVKVGVLLVVLGFIALITFRLVGSSIDADGILRELFALLPIGFLLVLVGCVTALIGWIKRRVQSRSRG